MSKGDDFERDMCHYLSLWISNGEFSWPLKKAADLEEKAYPSIFWRNRTRRTILSPDGKHQLGDIMATDPIGHPFVKLFNVELKTGYSKTKRGKRVKNIPWDLLDLIDYAAGKVGSFVLLDFWEQTKNDAELSKRIPLLIFSRDYHVPVVCIANHMVNKINDLVGGFINDTLQFSPYGLKRNLVFFRADDFFKWLTPEIVELLYNKESDEK